MPRYEREREWPSRGHRVMFSLKGNGEWRIKYAYQMDFNELLGGGEQPQLLDPHIAALKCAALEFNSSEENLEAKELGAAPSLILPPVQKSDALPGGSAPVSQPQIQDKFGGQQGRPRDGIPRTLGERKLPGACRGWHQEPRWVQGAAVKTHGLVHRAPESQDKKRQASCGRLLVKACFRPTLPQWIVLLY